MLPLLEGYAITKKKIISSNLIVGCHSSAVYCDTNLSGAGDAIF